MFDKFNTQFRHPIKLYELNNAVWCFGCSVTYGDAVNDNETMPFYLETIMGTKVINFGIKGGTNFNILFFLKSLLNNGYTPNAVVVQYTSLSRWTDENNKNYGPWNLLSSHPLFIEYNHRYKELINSGELLNISVSVLLEIQQLISGYPSVELRWSREPQLSSFFKYPQLDYGADNSHPGPNTHKYVADWVSTQLG
jgi:hypothetical protein